MKKRRALITGITGQDGSYLAELLLEKGYDVHGLIRRSSRDPLVRLSSLKDQVVFHYGDLRDRAALERAIAFCQSTLSYGAAQEAPPERKTIEVEPLIEEVYEALGLGLDVPIRRPSTTNPPCCPSRRTA